MASFQRKGESYVQATDDVKTAIQAASDAFSYDYPQAFWFRGSNYGYRVSCVRDGSSSTGYRGTFKNFTFKPANREISENAHTRMGDFMDGVQSAVAELNEQTVGMDMEQKIKRIHDYICQRVTYRNDNTLWVHSAASLFLDADPAFVCEGYAKSMKIFCYYMGINCACVSGTARGTSSGTPGAHMWNYVQMDDGNWYLVDATWMMWEPLHLHDICWWDALQRDNILPLVRSVWSIPVFLLLQQKRLVLCLFCRFWQKRVMQIIRGKMSPQLQLCLQ